MKYNKFSNFPSINKKEIAVYTYGQKSCYTMQSASVYVALGYFSGRGIFFLPRYERLIDLMSHFLKLEIILLLLLFLYVTVWLDPVLYSFLCLVCLDVCSLKYKSQQSMLYCLERHMAQSLRALIDPKVSSIPSDSRDNKCLELRYQEELTKTLKGMEHGIRTIYSAD